MIHFEHDISHNLLRSFDMTHSHPISIKHFLGNSASHFYLPIKAIVMSFNHAVNKMSFWVDSNHSFVVVAANNYMLFVNMILSAFS